MTVFAPIDALRPLEAVKYFAPGNANLNTHSPDLRGVFQKLDWGDLRYLYEVGRSSGVRAATSAAPSM